MSKVDVQNLEIKFDQATVISRLNLSVKEGEFLVLLGQSGCGKSTLLNAIAGLKDVSGGRIHIGEKNVTWAEPKDRNIGMVFQSYALYPRLTVKGNMEFGMKMAGVPVAERERRIAHAAELLHLTELLSRRPAQLSGGQRQRVAIGRALVRDAGVYLFDEPLSNLDAKLRNQLRVELKKLHSELGSTMIYVTHDQVEAMTLADRIAVMKDGVIQQLASPLEIYSRPANLFVAGFIGSPEMNFFEGTVTLREGEAFFLPDAEGAEAFGPIFVGTPPADGQKVVLGLRPEHLDLGGDLEMTVGIVEAMGAETVVWGTLWGQDASIRVQGSEKSHRSGKNLWVTPQIASAVLYDAASGQII